MLAAEQTNHGLQRVFVTAGYDVLVFIENIELFKMCFYSIVFQQIFNVADGGKLHSSKQDLHVRPMVAMIFVEQRDVLVTAGRDGSSLFLIIIF